MKLAERTFKRNDYRITSPFGNRIHPTTKETSFHRGVDYGTRLENWEIYPIEHGVVLASNYDPTNGHYLWIEYKRLNMKVFYCHLQKRFVVKGDTVDNDDMVGLVGTTGRSTGIHLHMGVKWIDTNTYFDHEMYDYEGEPPVKPIEDYQKAPEVETPIEEKETPLQRTYKRILDLTRSHMKW
jgi:murein DD-endopeptidase MepM/ murein hydrolase activator NlpD